MSNHFLQIYCSRYGRGGRPVAYGYLPKEGSENIGIEVDPAKDWIAPLDRILTNLPKTEDLYVYHADYEIKKAAPLFSSTARDRLRSALDLYPMLKAITGLAPESSYTMAHLAEKAGFSKAVAVGDAFVERFRIADPAALYDQIRHNLLAMKSIYSYYTALRKRTTRQGVQMTAFSLSPFQIRGRTPGGRDRYYQRDDILYWEEDGRFLFEADVRYMPYDAEKKALVLRGDFSISSAVPTPPGFVVFGIDDEIYYDVMAELLAYLRDCA